MMNRDEIRSRLQKVDEEIGGQLAAAISYDAYVRGGCRQRGRRLRELRAEKTELEAAMHMTDEKLRRDEADRDEGKAE